MKKGAFIDSIISILVTNKAIKPEEADKLKEAFRGRSKTSFDNFLLNEGIVDKEDILTALSKYYELPYFDPLGYPIKHSLLIKFPRDFLLRNALLPIERDGQILVMAVGNPQLIPELLPKIGDYVSYDIRFRVGLTRFIVDAINEFYDKSPAYVPRELK